MHPTERRGPVVNTPALVFWRSRRPAILTEAGECRDGVDKLGHDRFLPNPL
jgi:hypothetical protein